MTYQEFLDELTTYLTDELPAGTVPHLSSVWKNNGVKLDCLTVSSPRTSASPALYPRQYYQRLKRNESFESVAAEILSVYQDSSFANRLDLSFFQDPQRIRENIVCKLIHTRENEHLLKTVPHLSCLDLSVVFFLLLKIPETDTAATVLIENSHLKFWKLSAEDLPPLAIKNAPHLLPHEIIPMESMMREILKPDSVEWLLEKEKEADMPPLYVLTNRQRLFGAGALLYPHLLENFAREHNRDLYVLPSSVHEVILMPASNGYSREEQDDLTEIVRQVNRDHVSQGEFLSDHAYFYSRSDDIFRY